jgi:hypothetical protein
MPKIINAGTNPNIVKIEPNPKIKSTVKVKMEVLNVAGGQPKYTTLANGERKYHTKEKDPKNLSRLPGTVVEYCAPLGRNGLQTGLDEVVDNPYKDLDFYRPGWEKILKGNKKVRRQELLEYKHNKERGHYTNQVSDTMASKEVSDAPFYQRPESRVLLNDGVTYLDLNNPIQEVNYYMLKAHKNVANSFEELQFNPHATHYIVDETERSNREAGKVRKMNKFGARLEEIMDLSDNTIQDFCKALNIRVQGTNKADAYSALNAHVEAKDSHYDEFMDVYDLWKDVNTREVFEGYVELFDLLSIPGLLTMRNNKIYWSQPAGAGGKRESWEWKSKEQFVRQFLIDPSYQDEVDVLRDQYRAKTRY